MALDATRESASYGNANSGSSDADIKLWLLGGQGELAVAEPLYVHSHVLVRASAFFASRLSERWREEDTTATSPPAAAILDLGVTMPVQSEGAGHLYARCVQLMEGSCMLTPSGLAVESVREALELLQAASSILFDDCMKACMDYLASVPWNGYEEAALRSLFPLPLPLTEDLRSRLYVEGQSGSDSNVELFQVILAHVGAGIAATRRAQARPKLNKAIAALTGGNRSQLTRSCIQSFHALRCSRPAALELPRRWMQSGNPLSHALHLHAIFQKFLALAPSGVTLPRFANKKDLTQLVLVTSPAHRLHPQALATLLAGVKMLREISNGALVLPRQIRLIFTSVWLVVAARLLSPLAVWKQFKIKFRQVIEEGLCVVASTLPHQDQERVLRVWDALCPVDGLEVWPDISRALVAWCGKRK